MKNFQTINPQEVLITLHWPPARIGMMIEHREIDIFHGPLINRRRPGVIDNPIRRAVWRYSRRAQKDHDVIGILLDPGLIEKEQVARLRLAAVTANEDTAEILDCADIGRFFEPYVAAAD